MANEIKAEMEARQKIQECYKAFYEKLKADQAVEATADKLRITNREVIEALDPYDYVDFLVAVELISDIFDDHYLDNELTQAFLNAKGGEWR